MTLLVNIVLQILCLVLHGLIDNKIPFNWGPESHIAIGSLQALLAVVAHDHFNGDGTASEIGYRRSSRRWHFKRANLCKKPYM